MTLTVIREENPVKAAKIEYRMQMRSLLGDGWKTKSEKQKVYNIPANIITRKQLFHENHK